MKSSSPGGQCPTMGIYLIVFHNNNHSCDRIINKGGLIRVRGFSPPRLGKVCKHPSALALMAAFQSFPHRL